MGFLRHSRHSRHCSEAETVHIDTERLLAGVDFGTLLSAELGHPNGTGMWHCPFHQDGSPSFGLVPGRPLAHCFGCGVTVDAVGYLQRRRGLTFRDACEALAPGGALPVGPFARYPRQRAPAVRQSSPPPVTWANRAAEVAGRAATCLWTSAGSEGLEYLRHRGIADGTARAFRLGWIAEDLRDAPDLWGLPDTHKPLWIPAGVCIPWLVDGEHWRLNVRRLNPGDGPKYTGPSGFKSGLFNAAAMAPGRPVALVEGEFDALAVHQAAGDLCAAVAAGSTCGARAARWLYLLAAAPAVLVAFDADAAGDAASGWWLDKLPNARRLRPAGAKDPGEMRRERLRAWVAAGLGQTAAAGTGGKAPPVSNWNAWPSAQWTACLRTPKPWPPRGLADECRQ